MREWGHTNGNKYAGTFEFIFDTVIDVYDGLKEVSQCRKVNSDSWKPGMAGKVPLDGTQGATQEKTLYYLYVHRTEIPKESWTQHSEPDHSSEHTPDCSAIVVHTPAMP